MFDFTVNSDSLQIEVYSVFIALAKLLLQGAILKLQAIKCINL